MACNCAKRTPPLGFGRPVASPPPPPPQSGVTMSFALQTMDGSVMSFGSRLEADAARIRLGGGSIRSL